MNYTPLPQKLLNAVNPRPKEIIRDKKGRIIKAVAQDTNKNGTAGAPLKYSPDWVNEVYTYLKEVKEKRKKDIIFPTIEDFADRVDVDVNTVTRYANKKLKDEKGEITNKLVYPDFYRAIKRLKDLQKNYLMIDGFYGGKKVNAVMGIFLLKVNHNMIPADSDSYKEKENPQGKPVTGILEGETNVSSNNGN